MIQLKEKLEVFGIDTLTLAEFSYGGEAKLYKITTSTEEAISIWLRLRGVIDQTKYYPVIIDDMQAITNYSRGTWRETPPEILEQATNSSGNLSEAEEQNTNDIIDLILEAIENQYDYLGESYLAYEDNKHQVQTILIKDEYWKGDVNVTLEEQLGRITSELGSVFVSDSTEIVLFPTEYWWEIPALLRYYPADPGPTPVEQVRQFKKWGELYSAELVSMGRSNVTLRSIHPPSNPEDALRLAWEHREFCFDIDIFDVTHRAIQIYQGKAWNFWWD